MSSQNKFFTKTYLYNFDPFKSNFYIVKLGFTGGRVCVWGGGVGGYTLFFSFLLKIIDCGYLLEPAVLMSTHNLCFEQKYENIRLFI